MNHHLKEIADCHETMRRQSAAIHSLRIFVYRLMAMEDWPQHTNCEDDSCEACKLAESMREAADKSNVPAESSTTCHSGEIAEMVKTEARKLASAELESAADWCNEQFQNTPWNTHGMNDAATELRARSSNLFTPAPGTGEIAQS